MKRPLLVWGAGGNARVVAEIVRSSDRYEIVGFLDDVNPDRKGETFCDAPILGGEEALGSPAESGVEDLVVAMADVPARAERAAKAGALGYRLATLVHPTASVARDARIGPGTVIKAMAVVEPMASVGDSVSIGSLAYVGHAVVIGDGANICSGSRVAGSSVIGPRAWLATGAIIRDHVSVGEGTRIGVGAVVLGDIPAGVVAAGNPAEPRWRPGLFGGGAATDDVGEPPDGATDDTAGSGPSDR